jgi:glycosyltransferase involved in cell wall biosynthesis
VVEDGVTGFLCRPRDATDLTDKLTRMIELGRSERARMGLRGRAKVLSQFDERIVIGKYLEVLETLEQGRTISGHAA